MFYIKRKIYSLISFGLWASTMYCLFAIILNSTPLGSIVPFAIPMDSSKAADNIYWIAPVWLVFFILWIWAPKNESWGSRSKITRKQKKAMMEAINNPDSFQR